LLERLGAVARLRGDREAAPRWYEAGLEFAREAGVPRFLSLFHRALYECRRDEGDFEAALRHHEEYHRAEEASQRQFAAIQLADWQARIALEQAEAERDAARREAERERVRRAELAEANRHLEAANAENLSLLAEMKKHSALLSHQANRDPLTGLFNRRYLDGALAREVNRVGKEFAPLAVAIADLDNFKFINDNFSHQVGDVVLKTAARIFARSTRSGDILARYGGEEFVLALPGATAREADDVCNRVRREIAAYPWYEIHPGLSVTISIGVCAEPAATAAEVLAIADKRLYQAKRDGKNRVCVA
jgi:diguanylate cyclase (GGDEF)-like protein